MKAGHVRKPKGKMSKQPLSLLSSDIKWKLSFEFWREEFLKRKRFNAILLVQYSKGIPTIGGSYDLISIFKWKEMKRIAIDSCMADFAFKEFDPENNYSRYAVVDFN